MIMKSSQGKLVSHEMKWPHSQLKELFKYSTN